jgi:hypothetical protein
MFNAQHRGCAICNCKTAGGMGNFHLDHCHQTGRIRGLLCDRCNKMLGMAKDRPEILRAAAKYLER